MTIEDIALQMTPGIGVKGAVHLLGIFGDARGIFAAAPEELAMKAVLREDIIRNIVHRKGFAAAEKELGYCRRNSISAIASTDPEFPALLREIPDYPHVLYLKGNAAALSARCVAMVGTRRATPFPPGQAVPEAVRRTKWMPASARRLPAQGGRWKARPAP